MDKALIDALAARILSEVKEEVLKALSAQLGVTLTPGAAPAAAPAPAPVPAEAPPAPMRAAKQRRGGRKAKAVTPGHKTVAPDSKKTCSICGESKLVEKGFGYKVVHLVGGDVYKPQSACRDCRSKGLTPADFPNVHR